MKVFTKKDETLPENWEQEPNYIWIGGGNGELKASPLDNDFIGKKLIDEIKKMGITGFNKTQAIEMSIEFYEKQLMRGIHDYYENPIRDEFERIYKEFPDGEFNAVCQYKVSGDVFIKVWNQYYKKMV